MNLNPAARLKGKASRSRDLTSGQCKSGDSSIEFLLEADVDSDWILRKMGTNFNAEVVQKLKNAVYKIGQGSRRWFSGGGEPSRLQASTVLDYLVLIEILLQCRDDLHAYRDDLRDCREQLWMQVDRLTETQSGRVKAHVQGLVPPL